jgi:hypothetical protein
MPVERYHLTLTAGGRAVMQGWWASEATARRKFSGWIGEYGNLPASGQSSGSSRVVDTTVAGRLRVSVTHGSRTSDSSVLDAGICANARYVVAPNIIRCFSP